MDYSNDWLVSLIEDYKKIKQKSPLFISDWDTIHAEAKYPYNQIEKALNIPLNETLKYVSPDEQSVLKKTLAKELNAKGINLKSNNIAITVSPTASIYITLNLLIKAGIKRFLVLTPTYYTVLDTLISQNASIVYFHLRDLNNFLIDINAITETMAEQDIQAIVLSDPIYCCGIEVSIDIYDKLLKICFARDAWLIIDYALGGLDWDELHRSKNYVLKLNAAGTYKRTVLIESTAKRLLVNGLKSSIVITNIDLVAEIESLSCQVYGGFSLPQISLLEDLYSNKNEKEVSQIIENNVGIAKSNFQILTAFLLNTEFKLYTSNSGYFTMIIHKEYKIKEVDSKAIIKSYLFEEDLLAFPSFHFSIYEDNRFGFRVNLLQDLSRFIGPLENCIRKNLKALH